MNTLYTGKRILITGGAGYLASNVIKLLKDTNCHITRLDRAGTVFIPQSDGLAQVDDLIGDIRERRIWEQVLDGTDIILHFAAQTSIYTANENPPVDLDINVLPMLHLLETCRRMNLHPIILFSGTATETGITNHLPVDETHPDKPVTIYDLHKLMAEQYLTYYAREGIVRGTVLRLSNVYGPGPKSSSADRGVLNLMIRKALQGETLSIYGDGNYVRDYIYVEDVASAFLSAAANIDKTNGLHFLIGSGRGYTIAEAVNLVAERVSLKTGTRAKVVHVKPPESLSPIEARNFIANTSRFRQATGWQSKVSLIEGIDRTIENFLIESERIY